MVYFVKSLGKVHDYDIGLQALFCVYSLSSSKSPSSCVWQECPSLKPCCIGLKDLVGFQVTRDVADQHVLQYLAWDACERYLAVVDSVVMLSFLENRSSVKELLRIKKFSLRQ